MTLTITIFCSPGIAIDKVAARGSTSSAWISRGLFDVARDRIECSI